MTEPPRRFRIVLASGVVTKAAEAVAEWGPDGFAPASAWVQVGGRRVIYQVDADTKTQRVIGVLAVRHDGDQAFAEEIAPQLLYRPRSVWIDNIVTTDEIARRFAVDRATVRAWRSRSDDFPKPFMEAGKSALFDFAAIAAWAARHGKAGWSAVSLSASERDAAGRSHG